jgi:hypothetical protein
MYRHLRKPVVEGSPREMPPVVGQVTEALDQSLGTVKERILHPGEHRPSQAGIKPPAAEPKPEVQPPSAAPPESENGQPGKPSSADNGQPTDPSKDKKSQQET